VKVEVAGGGAQVMVDEADGRAEVESEESDQEDGGAAAMAGEKKKQPPKVFTEEEKSAFKQDISQFIDSKIEVKIDKKKFIPVRKIFEAFKQNGYNVLSETIFFKELGPLLTSLCPGVEHTNRNSKKICKNISFK